MYKQISFMLALCAATVASQDSPSCYDGVNILMARGTGEPQDGSVLEGIAKSIMSAIPDSNAAEVIYPANYSFLESATIGFANTQQQLFDYHNACPDNKIVLMGYSQGAAVIGAVLSGGGGIEFGIPVPQTPSLCGEIGQNVIAVIQIGDPGRNVGLGQDADTSGPACNVSASTPRTGPALAFFELYASRLQEWCAAADPICCATGKDLSAHTSYFTDSDEAAIASFVAGKYTNAAFPVSTTYNVTNCTPVSLPATPGSPTTTAVTTTGTESSVTTTEASATTSSNASMSGSIESSSTLPPSTLTATGVAPESQTTSTTGNAAQRTKLPGIQALAIGVAMALL